MGQVQVAWMKGWQRLTLFVALVVTVAMIVLATPSSGLAHAALISTSPGNDEVVPVAPTEIRLTFNEGVQPIEGSFRLFDGQQQETTLSARASGNDVVVGLPATMADGSWAMGWRVVSADGHPISGVLAFAIGESTGDVAVSVETEDRDVERTTAIVQGLAYAALLIAAGLVIFQRFIAPQADSGSLGRWLPPVLGVLGFVSWLALVPLGIVRQRGESLSAVWQEADWFEYLDGRMLATSLLIVGGLVLATLVAPLLAYSNADPLAVVGIVVALIGPTVSGHTRVFTPGWLIITSNLTHTFAAAVWIGGLLGLVLVLRANRHRADPDLTIAAIVARFSTLAGIAVALLIPTGLLTGWLVLDGIRPFVETTWGRLVLLKLGLVLVVVAMAAWNRFRLVPTIARHNDSANHARSVLRRIAGVEFTVLIVVVLVTGFLVNESPAVSQEPGTVPADHLVTEEFVVDLGDGEVRGTIEPLHAGSNTISFQLLDETGQPIDPRDAPQVQASLPAADLGPFVVTAVAGETAGYYTANITFPLSGEWDISVSVRVSTFEELRGSTTLAIPQLDHGH